MNIFPFFFSFGCLVLFYLSRLLLLLLFDSRPVETSYFLRVFLSMNVPDRRSSSAWKIQHWLFYWLIFYRGTAGMSGSMEGRLAALPDGPITAPRRHQWRGSLPLFRLRENPSAAVVVFAVASIGFDGRRIVIVLIVFRHQRSTPSNFPAGSKWWRHLQWIDISNRRITNPQTDER